MIVAIGSWLSTNWKLLSVAGTLLASGGTATYNHVVGADERFDAIEAADQIRQYQLDEIGEDVTDLKCMAIEQIQEGDPLNCLKNE